MFKKILKGLLLYSTIIVTMLFLCGIEDITKQGYFIYVLGVVLILIAMCNKYITYKDWYVLTMQRWLDKL